MFSLIRIYELNFQNYIEISRKMYPYQPGLYPTCSQFHGLYLTDLTSLVKTPKSQLQTKLRVVDKMAFGKIFGWVKENSKVQSPNIISKVSGPEVGESQYFTWSG